ncbi:NUC173-domain-containing protein [Neolentinus lepideus HHB14362 ss-1]|uniref:NUC173-domain-containing protein n=1 Tax=Neolentinus lepideus HHB14362 ss-1 TaxID=1314782 RepID=A0A165PS73_9AGAM|nr:NUC173-domain-containing protein [Neolentinus lepideus HHB14362 ss-1]
MEQTLSKIRPHTNSSLSHQKTPATLLRALEATLDEQKIERTPTAYFAALLTTLEGTMQKEGVSLGEGDVLPAELYLLSLVVPFVQPSIVCGNLNTFLSLTAPLFPHLNPHAPVLRSQITIYGAVIEVLDRSLLENTTIRQSFASLLQLCLDPRPKVRKKAAEAVKDILDKPPVPLMTHPYAERVAEWVQSILAEVNSGTPQKFKGKKSETDVAEIAIHLLSFLRPVLLKLPPSSFPFITSVLLSLPRFANPYLSQSAYSLLSDLLALPSSDSESRIADQTSDIVKAVVSNAPLKSDSTLAPAWLQVVGHAMLAYRASHPESCAQELGRVWMVIWPFLESSDAATRAAAAQSLQMLAQCFTPALFTAAMKEADAAAQKSTVGKIVVEARKALDALAFARSIPEVLLINAALFDNLRFRPGGSRATPTVAQSLMLPTVQKIAELRVKKNFEFKEAADATLGAAMSVLGPQVLLDTIPLNIEPADRHAGREPHAFLLPLLSQPHPSPLKHFIDYFIPLSERMFDYQQTAESDGRQAEAKLWSVLISQVWGGLIGYCYGTVDLRETLTPQFAQLLSQVVYTQPDLRPAVLRTLKVIISSNIALASEPGSEARGELPSCVEADAITPEAAAQNVQYLKTQAESWLAVLFNVFSMEDDRSTVGDVIAAWAALAGEKEVTKAYAKVLDLFKRNIESNAEGSESVTATTQDLLVILLPYLTASDASALFEFCLSPHVIGHKDNAVQKRGYKILARLAESSKVPFGAEEVLRQLEHVMDKLGAAGKKDRYHLLSIIVTNLPANSLHLIPSLIPEAVLGTKEASERARSAAFDLVVAMGNKMNQGGIVKRDMVDGMDEDSAGEVAASIEEYMTMVAGGLAGASPHMVSATVTAISRLIFEFKDSISTKMHGEIFSTLLVFLSSANREIVKSTLGYVKLAIHTLPIELIRPQLPELVNALLGWSHQHNNHFKLKVRHIFERMIRRFGYEDVYTCAQEEDGRKVLLNIKKRKDRAKRKKAMADEVEDAQDASAEHVTGDAFEDVLYGSESELESSDDEGPSQPSKQKRRGNNVGARLRLDGDEPMDLLEGAASRIATSQSRRRKPGQDASLFKTDGDTGKMVIDDSDSNEAPMEEDVVGTAYREGLTSVDGFTRGPNGRMKANKNTKKRRRENREVDQDVEMEDVIGGQGGKKDSKQRKPEPKLGHEFKAKRAGGDIKKGGVDPYAYLPLSQAAKKGRRSKIGITSKR